MGGQRQRGACRAADVSKGMEITFHYSGNHTEISRRSLIFIEHRTHHMQNITDPLTDRPVECVLIFFFHRTVIMNLHEHGHTRGSRYSGKQLLCLVMLAFHFEHLSSHRVERERERERRCAAKSLAPQPCCSPALGFMFTLLWECFVDLAGGAYLVTAVGVESSSAP